MIEQLKDLKDFHTAVAKKTGSRTSSLNQAFVAGNATAKLRSDLLIEESDELSNALFEGSEAEALKELCDVLYVALGIAVTYNWPILEAFKAVHKDNMKKLTSGTQGPSGKFVKPKGWKKVDLQPLLDRYKAFFDKVQNDQLRFFE